MKRKGSLIGSAALLCFFSLACKGSGMLFRLYLSNRIGSEGIGLYQLVLSVYSLFASFATAGFSVSVSKLAAEELESGRGSSRVVKTSVRLAAVLGVLSTVSLLALSSPVSALLLGDSRTLMPLRILSLCMPFMALSSCIKGAFIAERRIIIPASSQLFEEICKISLSMGIISVFCGTTNDIGRLCTGITVGLTAGEAFSFLYVFAFRIFSRRYRGDMKEKYPFRDFSKVLFPNAVGGWLTSGLHTVENILIPYCFTLYGGGQAKALSDFGMIRGMVIPVLFFPFAFLSALISILIPEISRLNTFAVKTARDAKIEKTLRVAFLFGIAAGGIFFFFPGEIGLAFYRSAESARAFRLLALVTPMMYVETIADGLLKGIGEQNYTMRVTLINCAFRIAVIFLLIPSTGAEGYLWLLIVSNTFSFVMCLVRILKVSLVRISFIRYTLVPVVCAAASGFTARFAVSYIEGSHMLTAACAVTVFSAVYFVLIAAVNGFGHRKTV